MTAAVLGRFLATSFFAIVFLQSSADKVLDRQGNLEYMRDHFKSSPFPADSVPLLLSILTVIEAAAGVLCGIGIISGSFLHHGMGIAGTGVLVANLALLCLLMGQRLAKDYAGAAVVAAYFAVGLIGLAAFS